MARGVGDVCSGDADVVRIDCNCYQRGNKEDTHAFYRLSAPRVFFDLDGDGDLDFISWTAAGSNLAFLAMDRNGNGTIDNGKELFGNYTTTGAMDGFRALQLSAPQGTDGRDNAIDAADPIYSKLLLWEDRNSDATSQPEELRPLSDIYASIGLGFIPLVSTAPAPIAASAIPATVPARVSTRIAAGRPG